MFVSAILAHILKAEKTHGKSTQLASTPLSPDSPDLRSLARHSQHPGSSLRISKRFHIHNALILQRPPRSQQSSSKHTSRSGLPLILQHQQTNDHILSHYQGSLAIRAERIATPRAICKRDDKGGCFKDVGKEGDARGGLGVEQFYDLRDLDYGGAGDDADAEGFGGGELEAFGRAEVDVEDERPVAIGAEEGDAEFEEGSGKGARYRLEDITYSVHIGPVTEVSGNR